MPTSPAELLRSAKLIDCKFEAACRAAISRAYYCAYHAALPVVERLPSSPDYALSGYLRHSEVAARIIAWNAPPEWAGVVGKSGNIAVIKRQYRAALAKRKISDYRLTSDVRDQDVKDQIADVAEVLNFFVRLKGSLDSLSAGL